MEPMTWERIPEQIDTWYIEEELFDELPEELSRHIVLHDLSRELTDGRYMIIYGNGIPKPLFEGDYIIKPDCEIPDVIPREEMHDSYRRVWR